MQTCFITQCSHIRTFLVVVFTLIAVNHFMEKNIGTLFNRSAQPMDIECVKILNNMTIKTAQQYSV